MTIRAPIGAHLHQANQRTQDTLNDGSYWQYGYDPLGQVTNGWKFFPSGTRVAGQTFDYLFDNIGNRFQTQIGGNQNGANLRAANYVNNPLNQITNRDVPGYVEVTGASVLTNAVTVNGSTAYRNQEYFWQEVAVNNNTAPVWENISVSGGQSVSGNVYVAKEPETFSYDQDGNLSTDGRWNYVWDGENRLTQMTVNNSVGPQYQLTFIYDWQGRRIQKLVATLSGSTYVPTQTNVFGYDGWHLAAELNPAATPSLLRSYVWGSDLSGSLQGAGGVGGLLEISYHASSTTNCFAAYDGNGNVMALINAANGTISAEYDYGPFGEVIRATGPMAKANPFTFGTYFYDWETDKSYAKNRYYDPSSGRWLSRDPAGESGINVMAGNEDAVGMAAPDNNLYEFVGDNPISQVDPMGLAFYAIDGTWAKAGDGTNPEKMYNWTKEDPKRYYRGPQGLFNGATGISTLAIAKNVKHQICEDYCAVGGKDFTVNLTGWSRGAVAAVWVAVLLNEEGCDCGCGTKRPIPVNWIGLFDACNMAWTEPPPSSIPGNVAHFYHAVKTRTDQWYFPTFHFSGGTEKKIYNYRDPILSSHSDVGTSDTATETHINGAENWIQDTATASGVKF